MNVKRTGTLAGRKIALLTRYGDAGPSSRLRFHQYVPALEAAGAQVRAEPFLDNGYVERFFASGERSRSAMARGYARRLAAIIRGRADLIWVEKEAFPFLPGIFERAFAARGIPYVVDYDDAIFHNYDLATSPLARRILGTKLDPLLACAALVTAGNDYLADYAVSHGARQVIDIPTVVDVGDYEVVEPVDDGQLRIGWIGTPGNAIYLAPVVEAINRLSNRLRLRLVTIGAGEVPGLIVPHDRYAWSAQTQAMHLGQIDIGVMPLVDSPWERGKCGFKLVQYMAAGRPVIASPVGVNQQIVQSDVGLLATSVDDWMTAIDTLARDPVRRRTMGRSARAAAEMRYSLQATAPRLVDAFAEVLATAR